jgi:erythromycin esterase-like protein
LPALDDPDFGSPFDRFADRRVILLGEATHGTSEFYGARAAITRRLIEEHGFTIVAVEADWPEAAAVRRAKDLTCSSRAPTFSRARCSAARCTADTGSRPQARGLQL